MSTLIKIISDTFEVEIDSRNANERRAKAVGQYNLDGELLAEFSSISEAQRQLGILHISECVNGLRKTAGGYLWRLQGENDE